VNWSPKLVLRVKSVISRTVLNGTSTRASPPASGSRVLRFMCGCMAMPRAGTWAKSMDELENGSAHTTGSGITELSGRKVLP
jgi:hypothetical protein